jgi:hypothetical protein
MGTRMAYKSMRCAANTSLSSFHALGLTTSVTMMRDSSSLIIRDLEIEQITVGEVIPPVVTNSLVPKS